MHRRRGVAPQSATSREFIEFTSSSPTVHARDIAFRRLVT
jgi:hypothetical protein